MNLEETLKRSNKVRKTSCLFCQLDAGHLHQFQTLEADNAITNVAINFQEFKLLSRTEGGDLLAYDARYHLDCMTKLRNHY